ncbi:MAG: hypothetical protein AAF196_13085 [Planctomycetota bacterium]
MPRGPERRPDRRDSQPERRRKDGGDKSRSHPGGRKGPNKGRRDERSGPRAGHRPDRPVEAPAPITTEVKATVHRLDGQGQALCRLEDGERAAVRGGLPNESLKLKRIQTGSHVRFELDAVETAEASRIEAACRHFGSCSGCRVQHIADDKRLELLIDRARYILSERVTDLPEIEVPTSAARPAGLRPRTTFFLEGGQLSLPSVRGRALDAIAECPASDPRVVSVAQAIADEARARRVDALEAMIVHAAAGTDSVHATLVADTGRLPHAQRLAEAAQAAGATGTSLTPKSDRREELLGPRTIPLLGEPKLRERLAGIDLRFSPHSFVEPSPTTAEAAARFVQENATYADTAIDLFCGTGLWAFTVAGSARKVVAVDHQRNSIQDAEVVAEGAGNIEFRCARAELEMEALGRLDADLVTADPPRGGLRDLAPAIARSIRPSRLVFSGRDPVEMARDLGELQVLGYRVHRLQLVESDPWNYGLVLLACLDDEGSD